MDKMRRRVPRVALFSIVALGLFALPPGQATAGLAVRASAVSGPAIGVSPTSHDFGRVNVGSGSATFDFTIALGGVANNAPVFNPALAPTYSAVAFVPFTLTATADDPEGDELSWSITGLPLGTTFDGSTGTLDWPNPGPAGSHPMTISVSDGIATSSASFTITVTADNSPPTANPGGPYNG